MTRRSEGLLGLLLAVLLAACTAGGGQQPVPPSDPDATGSAAEPAGGGTFRYGIAEPTAIVPHLAATGDDRAVVDAVYDSLTAWDAAGRPVPAAAESWVAADGQARWTFTLRADATFHDGSPVTAADFARGWALAAAGGPAGYLLEDVVGYQAVRRGDLPTLSGVRVEDERTLVVTLVRPRSDLAEVLGHPTLGPLHAADALGTQVVRQPIGNGPFRVVQPWSPGDFIRTATWAGWRNGVRADRGVDEVLFRIGDLDINFLAFTQGRRDLATVPVDALALAAEDFPGGAGAWDGPGLITGGRPEVYVLAMDRHVPPYDDLRVREAVSLAIDRAALASRIEGGNVVPAGSLLPPSLPGARIDVCDLCTSNPTGAGERLAEAGVRQLTFAFNAGGGHEQVRDALRQVLSDLGVALVSNGRGPAPDLPAYQQELAAGGVGLFRLPLVADVPSALSVLWPLLHSRATPAAGGLNAMGYADPQVDALLEQAARTADPLRREALLRRVEDLALNRDVVVVPLFSYQHAVVSAPSVQGLRYGPFGLVDLTAVVLGEDPVSG